MIPQNCPYNIQRVTEFQGPYGDKGYEAIIREWGRKVGTLVAPPTPLTLLGFGAADEAKFRILAEESGFISSVLFAEALVKGFQALKAEVKVQKYLAAQTSAEIRRLERAVEKHGTLYRLLGFPPKKWEWMATQDISAVSRILERTYPGQVETIINLDSLKSPTFVLPY